MTVPTTIADLDPVAANNSPAGSEAIGNSLDDYLRAHAAIIKQVANSSYSDKYTPTAAGTHTNIASVSFPEIGYTVVGDMMQVSGAITAQTTAAGGTATVVKMSLPVSTTFANARDAGGGGGNAATGSRDPILVRAVAGSNHVELVWDSTSTANSARYFSFGARII